MADAMRPSGRVRLCPSRPSFLAGAGRPRSCTAAKFWRTRSTLVSRLTDRLVPEATTAIEPKPRFDAPRSTYRGTTECLSESADSEAADRLEMAAVPDSEGAPLSRRRVDRMGMPWRRSAWSTASASAPICDAIRAHPGGGRRKRMLRRAASSTGRRLIPSGSRRRCPRSLARGSSGRVAVCALQLSGRAGRGDHTYTIFEGTSEIQRLVISRAITGIHIP